MKIVGKLSGNDTYFKRRDIVSSDSGNKYRIAIRNSDKRWTCSCTGWTRVCNSRGTDCKHITALKNKYGSMMNDGASTAFDAAMVSMHDILAAIRNKKASALNLWLAAKEQVENVQDYLQLLEDKTRATEFDTLFNEMRSELTAFLGA